MTDEVSMTANELLSKMKELDQGDLMRGLLELVFQAGLEAERDEHIGVGRYERGEERSDTRSGYKPRRLETLVGTLNLRRPQTRDGMRSGLLENYQRMDQALLTMATEMYANGVSTRRVKKVLEDTIGTSVSAATVSNANRLLDKGVSALRSRPLGEYPALIVDARFDKVRRDGAVRSMALLVVTGVDSDGYRHVLDFKAVEGERGAYWEDLFQGLKRRGLHGVLYMVSDDHAGLRDALAREFVGATWQRCQTHITRNILKRTPSAWKSAVASRVKDCFTAPTEEQARERLDELVKFGDKVSSGLGDYLEEPMLDGFAVYAVDESLRKRLRTTNMLERINQEILRRTKVVRIFPHVESYERLAGTVLVHTEGRWQEANYRYLNVDLLKESLCTKNQPEGGGASG